MTTEAPKPARTPRKPRVTIGCRSQLRAHPLPHHRGLGPRAVPPRRNPQSTRRRRFRYPTRAR